MPGRVLVFEPPMRGHLRHTLLSYGRVAAHRAPLGWIVALALLLAGPAWCARRAILYTGAAADEASADALEVLLGGEGYEVRRVSRLALVPPLLPRAELFVIGGTDDDIVPLLAQAKPSVRAALARWIEAGGSYLGICGGAVMGGLSWEEDGELQQTLELAPVESGELDRGVEDCVVPVRWRGRPVSLYFQNSPWLAPARDADPSRVDTIARYASGQPAALAYRRGRGRVLLIGPHPEATAEWIEPGTPGGRTWRDASALLEELLR